MSTDQAKPSALGDVYDRQLRSVLGRKDVVSTAPSTKTVYTAITEISQQYTVQTYRVAEEGDWVFVIYVDTNGAVRMAIPPQVTKLIASQRDALTTKNRKRASREQMKLRMEKGWKPTPPKRKAKKS